MAKSNTTTAKKSTSKEVATTNGGKGGKAIAKSKNTDQGSSSTLPAALGNSMQQYSGAGMESADRDSFAIPFLAIMQKMSPQVDKDEDSYVEGAEVGDLMLTTTGELFKDEDGADIIFCGYRRVFLRWAPKESGGGFKGEVPVDVVVSDRALGRIKEEDGKLFYDNGDIVKDTRVHYVLVLREDGTSVQAVLSCASTQIKKSKMLMTQLNQFAAKDADGNAFNPPMFAHIFHAETVAEQNDKGSWRGWKFTRTGFVEDANLFKSAVAFYEAMRADNVRVNFADVEATGGHDNDEKM